MTTTKPKSFKALRMYAQMRNCDTKDLGKPINMDPGAISRRMTGKVEWTRKEMYAILEFLDLTTDFLPVIFPEDIYEDYVL
ncbi:MAG: hypothetical protein Q4E09_06100 [Eubacteriales bacterium]|nr:hypothetical protein [Eubacteriales bacterium]